MTKISLLPEQANYQKIKFETIILKLINLRLLRVITDMGYLIMALSEKLFLKRIFLKKIKRLNLYLLMMIGSLLLNLLI